MDRGTYREGQQMRNTGRKKKSDSPGRWAEMRGHRGVISHVYHGNLQVVVREDFLATKLRFRVFVYSREVSRHATMEAARLEVLRRLDDLAKEQDIGFSQEPDAI
jgi:hypothetical protein